MDGKTERRLRDDIRRLLRALEREDVDDFETMLRSAACPLLLRSIRERKLVLRAPADHRPQIARTLAATAERVLGEVDAAQFALCVDLTLLIASTAAVVQVELDRITARLPRMALSELLSLAQKVFSDFAAPLFDREKEWYDLSRPVGYVEREWHDLNGRVADVTAAVCRAVNVASPCIDRKRRLRDDRRQAANRDLSRMAVLGSVLNALDWVRDSVAFGDLNVTKLSDGPPVTVELEFCDARRSLLRTLGTRRDVVMESFAKRPKRFISTWLEDAYGPAMENAVTRYHRAVSFTDFADDEIEAARRHQDIHLASLDFEDDMVVIAGEGRAEIIGRYLLSSMLRWNETAAAIVARGLPRRNARMFLPAAIHLNDLVGELSDQGQAGIIERAWAEETIELPIINHWDLVRRPFVREQPASARPLLHGATGKWNAAIRERLLRGGELSKEIGRKWEEYFGDRFREAGWQVVGQGVRLNIDGRTVTDVDLLVVRDDLLLVAQVKVLGGAALNPYDHWKYRKVIEKGCWQASVSHRHMMADRSLIEGVMGKRGAARVSRIEPVVITNLPQYDGWTYEGVPVIAEIGLKAITIGSKVDYIDAKQDEVISTRVFHSADDLNTDVILRALRSPIELAISPENGDVCHITESVGGLTFVIPQFAVAEEPASVS